MVQDINEVRAELSADALRDARVLPKPHIPLEHRGSIKGETADVACATRNGVKEYLVEAGAGAVAQVIGPDSLAGLGVDDARIDVVDGSVAGLKDTKQVLDLVLRQ